MIIKMPIWAFFLIDLKAEDKALVTARVGNMDCAMGYVSITSEVDNKPFWKLDNLKCQ